MGSLSNLYISQSYQSLIHFGNDSSASTSLVELQDGVGNGLGVSLNTRGELKTSGLLVSGAVDISTTFSGSTQGFVNQSSINNEIQITGSYPVTGNTASISEIGIGWLVNGGAVVNGRVIGISGTPNSNVTYTIDQFYTANNVTYSFTGSIQRAVQINGDFEVNGLTNLTGSLVVSNAITASNIYVSNDLIVSGTINAYEIITTIESSSVIFSSGSNILGDSTSDIQTLNGLVIISGSSSLTGSMGITDNLNVLGNISSSTISGIGNVTTFSQSVDSRLDSIESFTGSYATTGSNTFIGNQIFSGSVRGGVNALTITSNTASMNCSLGNFFTLTLPSSSATQINPSNILPGETISLRVTQAASGTGGTVTFPTTIKFAALTPYVASTGNNSVDILTFISFDSSSLYAASVKTLI